MVSARLALAVLLLALPPSVPATAAQTPDWTAPIAPFRIAEGLYYVGSRDLAAYLVVTPQGDILINSNLASSPALIRKSVEQLGFKFTDIKILLISHAHSDHAAGSAEILRLTHAQYMVMDGDVATVETGGVHDFAYLNDHYPPAHVDRILHDGDEVKLGSAVLTAHKTAGHTPGTTTWTMQAVSGGRRRNVVIVGSWNVNPTYRLVDRPGKPASYPGIATDFDHAFAVFHALPCDIFLGAHGIYFNMLAKLGRSTGGADESVWIDPAAYAAAVADRERAFRAELKKQQQGAK